MNESDKKWAKLYTQLDYQMLGLLMPVDGGWIVQTQMMYGNDMYTDTIFEGASLKSAINTFNKITRDDAQKMRDYLLSGTTPPTKDVVEEVADPVKNEEVESEPEPKKKEPKKKKSATTVKAKAKTKAKSKD